MAFLLNVTHVDVIGQSICFVPNPANSNGFWSGQQPLQFSLPLLLMQMVSVIVVVNIIHLFLKPFKQPLIIAELLTSFLMGPSGLGRNENYTNILFPERGANILDTLSRVGMVYYLFLAGVKMDPTLMWRTGRKAVIVAITGIIVPMLFSACTFFMLSEYTHHSGFRNTLFCVAFIINTSITPFPVLQSILDEFNLLSSKLGRFAMSAAMTNQVLWMISITLLLFVWTSELDIASAYYFAASNFTLTAITIFLIKPMMVWIVRNTPEGRPISQGYVPTILLGALVMGLFGDIFTGNMYMGPLLFGLVIPDGPPLAVAIEEKINMVVHGFLMPLFIISGGMRVDVFEVKNLSFRFTIQTVYLVSWAFKVLGTLTACIYNKMPFTESLMVGLIMGLQGEVEAFNFNRWYDRKLLDNESFGALLLSITLLTAISTPAVTHLSKLTKMSMDTHKLRTVQHNKPHSELRILTCIHNKDTVPSILSLLEASYPTRENPSCIYILHLVELVGRASPMLIAHKKNKGSATSSSIDHIVSAFQKFERQHGGDGVMIQPFTCIAPYNTMNEDISHFAFDKKVALIIIPFHKQRGTRVEIVDRCFQIINPKVLAEAPCSVAILVDQVGSNSYLHQSEHRVCILFLGGPDDREALAVGFRFILHPRISLTIVRFLPMDPRGDDEHERELDDDLLEDFRVRIVGNERVLYREVVVRHGEDTVNEIKNMEEVYDIIVVGLKQKTNPSIVEGLVEWSENPEIGPIGDIVSSCDAFGGMASVLILKQQVI